MNKSLKELLDTVFTANEEGILVGSFTLDRINEIADCINNLQEKNERLLHIAKKMHTYIFLNTDNEQEAYDKLGLTEEENIMLGYSGQIIITGGDNNE